MLKYIFYCFFNTISINIFLIIIIIFFNFWSMGQNLNHRFDFYPIGQIRYIIFFLMYWSFHLFFDMCVPAETNRNTSYIIRTYGHKDKKDGILKYYYNIYIHIYMKCICMNFLFYFYIGGMCTVIIIIIHFYSFFFFFSLFLLWFLFKIFLIFFEFIFNMINIYFFFLFLYFIFYIIYFKIYKIYIHTYI